MVTDFFLRYFIFVILFHTQSFPLHCGPGVDSLSDRNKFVVCFTYFFFIAWPIQSHCQGILVQLHCRCCSTNVNITHYFFSYIKLGWSTCCCCCCCLLFSVDSLRAGRSGDRIPVGTSFSVPVQTGPVTHTASYTMGTGSFSGVKRPGRGVDHPPSYSAGVKERDELYLYSTSGPSWPVIGWPLSLNLPAVTIKCPNKKFCQYDNETTEEGSVSTIETLCASNILQKCGSTP